MRALRWISFLVIVLMLAVITDVFSLEAAAVIFIVTYVWNAMIFFSVVDEYEFKPIFVTSIYTCLSLTAAYFAYGIIMSDKDFSWLLIFKSLIHTFVVWQYFILPLVLRKMSDYQKNRSST